MQVCEPAAVWIDIAEGRVMQHSLILPRNEIYIHPTRLRVKAVDKKYNKIVVTEFF